MLFIYINWWSLTIFYIKMLELSSSFDTGLCKIPVDLYSPVRILETSAFLAHSVCLCWVRNRLLWSLQFIRIDQVSSFSVI